METEPEPEPELLPPSIETEPPGSAPVELPPEITTLPPVWEESPDERNRRPPAPLSPEPTTTDRLPPRPLDAAPLVKATHPEFPETVVPVLNRMPPEAVEVPAVPAAVNREIPPLIPESLGPDTTCTAPPGWEIPLVKPAPIDTEPPTPEVPEPTCRTMLPPCPDVETPLEICTLPEFPDKEYPVLSRSDPLPVPVNELDDVMTTEPVTPDVESPLLT